MEITNTFQNFSSMRKHFKELIGNIEIYYYVVLFYLVFYLFREAIIYSYFSKEVMFSDKDIMRPRRL